MLLVRILVTEWMLVFTVRDKTDVEYRLSQMCVSAVMISILAMLG